MTHLNIQQGSNVEIVSAQIIKKLYDTALTVSEPLEGETDAAYMSGHISVPHTYAEYVEYLAGEIGEGNSGVVTSRIQNPTGRFQDLTIDVTNGAYLMIDEAVKQLVADTYGDGVGVTKAQLASVTRLPYATVSSTPNVGTLFRDNTDWQDGSFISKMTLSTINKYEFAGCTNLRTFGSNPFANVTWLGYNAFSGCNNLEGELNFPSLTNLDTNAGGSNFCSCLKVTKISLGHITSLKGHDYSLNNRDIFDNCQLLRTVDMGDGEFTLYGGSIFRRNPAMECIVFRNTTPPTTVSGNVSQLFGSNNTCKVFVPDNAVNDYSAVTLFSDLGTTRLRPLSEYEAGVANGIYI